MLPVKKRSTMREIRRIYVSEWEQRWKRTEARIQKRRISTKSFLHEHNDRVHARDGSRLQRPKNIRTPDRGDGVEERIGDDGLGRRRVRQMSERRRWRNLRAQTAHHFIRECHQVPPRKGPDCSNLTRIKKWKIRVFSFPPVLTTAPSGAAQSPLWEAPLFLSPLPSHLP